VIVYPNLTAFLDPHTGVVNAAKIDRFRSSLPELTRKYIADLFPYSITNDDAYRLMSYTLARFDALLKMRDERMSVRVKDAGSMPLPAILGAIIQIKFESLQRQHASIELPSRFDFSTRLTSPTTDSHAFTARSSLNWAKGFLLSGSALSIASYLAIRFVADSVTTQGFLGLGVTLGIYIALSSIRFFILGRKVRAALMGRGLSREEAMITPIATSDNKPPHPAFYDLSQNAKRLILLHESITPHWSGMIGIMPLLAFMDNTPMELFESFIEQSWPKKYKTKNSDGSEYAMITMGSPLEIDWSLLAGIIKTKRDARAAVSIVADEIEKRTTQEASVWRDDSGPVVKDGVDIDVVIDMVGVIELLNDPLEFRRRIDKELAEQAVQNRSSHAFRVLGFGGLDWVVLAGAVTAFAGRYILLNFHNMSLMYFLIVPSIAILGLVFTGTSAVRVCTAYQAIRLAHPDMSLWQALRHNIGHDNDALIILKTISPYTYNQILYHETFKFHWVGLTTFIPGVKAPVLVQFESMVERLVKRGRMPVIVSDLDGTLSESNLPIAPEMADAIIEILKGGSTFAVLSGISKSRVE
ncbi:MAG: hypothetical protein WC738_07635, partial [Candidatus Omnitrophota bacterium]